jgi:hypothetical protein
VNAGHHYSIYSSLMDMFMESVLFGWFIKVIGLQEVYDRYFILFFVVVH